MPKFKMVCEYCDHKWEEFYWNNNSLANLKCSKCKDRNIRYSQVEESVGGNDVYGYRFSPPFPERKDDTYEQVYLHTD